MLRTVHTNRLGLFGRNLIHRHPPFGECQHNLGVVDALRHDGFLRPYSPNWKVLLVYRKNNIKATQGIKNIF